MKKESTWIYRRGDPKRPKEAALRREQDWISGLSFSTVATGQHLKYSVKKLRKAGYTVRFDNSGDPVTDVHTGQIPDPKYGLNGRTFGPNHVTVYLADLTRWDNWYQDEEKLRGTDPYNPAFETRRLYDLREQ